MKCLRKKERKSKCIKKAKKRPKKKRVYIVGRKYERKAQASKEAKTPPFINYFAA